jgi:transcriptional regulator with XRE-family HTH domain
VGRGFVSEIDLLERIRLNIRARRAASSWSVGHAAKRAGMHARHWQKLEACEVNATLRTLSRIALVFGVDAAELVAVPSPLPPPVPPALDEMPPAARRRRRAGATSAKPSASTKATKPAKAAGSAKAAATVKATTKGGKVAGASKLTRAARAPKKSAKAAKAKAAPAKSDAPGKPRAS